MLILRLVAILVVIGVGASLLAYVVTRQQRYLAFSWRLLFYGVCFALLFFALVLIERLALIPV